MLESELKNRGAHKIDKLEKSSKRDESPPLQIKVLDKLGGVDETFEQTPDLDITMKAIFEVIRPKYVRAIIYHILATVVRIGIPFILQEFLREVENETDDNQRLFLYGFSATFLTFLSGILKQHALANTCGCKAMTGQLIRCIFMRKLSVCSHSFLIASNESLINKMILYELDHILSYIGELPKLWAVPINLILNFYFIYITLKWRLLMVFAVFLVGVILLGIIKRQSVAAVRNYQIMETMRTVRIAECIPKMKSVKVNNMCSYFKSRLSEIRKISSKFLMRMDIFDSFSDSVFEGTPLFCSILIIGSLALFKGGLDISQAFAAISVLEILNDPLDSLANSFDKMEAYSSAKESLRLFLEEVPEKPIKNDPRKSIQNLGPQIKINNCNFDFEIGEKMSNLLNQIIGRKVKTKDLKLIKKMKSKIGLTVIEGAKFKERKSRFESFNGNFRTHTLAPSLPFHKIADLKIRMKKQRRRKNLTQTLLKRITIKIEAGQKVCLVGKAGSGFSEFLLALMGEARISNSGEFLVNGTISYLNASMYSFVNGTINDNITIGAKFDKERLQEVTEMLNINLKSLRGRGYHQVLEGAKNLSLELKRKILLARWIYKKSDIYLVDDLFDELNRVEWSLIHRELFLKELKDKIVIYMSYDNAQIKVKLILWQKAY